MPALTPQEREINARVISIYEHLKGLRKVRNKSDFCNMLGLPSEYFSRFEKNKLLVPDKAIEELSVLFDIDEDWIIAGVGRDPFENVTQASNVGSFNKSGRDQSINTGTSFAPPTATIEVLQREVEHLKEIIKLKDEMIEMLKKSKG